MQANQKVKNKLLERKAQQPRNKNVILAWIQDVALVNNNYSTWPTFLDFFLHHNNTASSNFYCRKIKLYFYKDSISLKNTVDYQDSKSYQYSCTSNTTKKVSIFPRIPLSYFLSHTHYCFRKTI